MGQHKQNPKAIAAKNNELPPKPKPLSQRETNLLLEELVKQAIEQKTPLVNLLKNYNILR